MLIVDNNKLLYELYHANYNTTSRAGRRIGRFLGHEQNNRRTEGWTPRMRGLAIFQAWFDTTRSVPDRPCVRVTVSQTNHTLSLAPTCDVNTATLPAFAFPWARLRLGQRALPSPILASCASRAQDLWLIVTPRTTARTC